MISATFLFIGKLLLIFLILGGMIMILMGIGHLFHNDDLNSMDDDLKLRDEIENNEDVVSTNSVFYNFLPTEKTNKPEKKD